MIDFLIVIFFISLIALAFAIFNPKSMNLRSRRSAAKVFIPIVTVLLVLVLIGI